MKVNIALLTVTDTRTFDNDKSGAILVDKIKEADHNLIDRKICKDNKNEIVVIIKEWLKIEKIDVFELKSLNLRSYYHENILAFGDLLHKVHPLAGQGFNMTIRDIKTLINIINNKIFLGLPLDSSVSEEFENISKHKNFIFSNGIDLIHEFFNFERKTKNTLLSKSIQKIGNNPSINKMFAKIADTGILF